MSELNLRLITTNNPASLENVLHCSQESGLHLKSFTAELIPERGHYEVRMCVSGCTNQHELVGRLASQEHIRELTPLKRKGLI